MPVHTYNFKTYAVSVSARTHSHTTHTKILSNQTTLDCSLCTQ